MASPLSSSLIVLFLGFIKQGSSHIENNGTSAGSGIPKPTTNIYLAVLTDITSIHYSTGGYENLAAARLAIRDINADTSFLPDYYFDMVFKDDGCEEEAGLKAINDAYNGDKKISALIGISCSVVCDLAGYLCATDQWNIPVVSHSCSSDNLSDLDTFPTFARLSLSVYKYVDSIIDLCQEFSWHKVGLMVNNIEWYVKTANKMKNTMSSNPRYGINVYLEKFYFDNEDEASGAADNEQSDTYRLMVEQLNRLKKKVRVIIIVGYARDILFVLKTANKLGMNNGHFAFITQEFIQAELDKTDKQLVASINGVIDLEPFQNKSDVNYISFSTSVKSIVEEQGYKKTDKDVVNLVAAQMYDAVWLYAKAMSLALEQGVSIDNGEELVSIMSELKWTGKSGEIVIDQFGDRMGNVQIMNIQDGEFQHVGTWWMSRRKQLDLAKDSENKTQIIWPGNPESEPVACGRQYELCQSESDAMAKIILMALVCMAFLFGLLVRLYLYNRTNK